MVTYVTKYAVDVPYEQTVGLHRISNANKQTDSVEIFLNKVCSLKSLYFVCSCMPYIEKLVSSPLASIHIFTRITKSYLVILKGTLENSTIQRYILVKLGIVKMVNLS